MPKRPRSKILLNARKGAVGTSQVNTVVVASGVSRRTWIGGVIRDGIAKGGSASGGRCALALVIRRETQAQSLLSLTDSDKLFAPEENVLWMHPFQFSAGADAVQSFVIAESLKSKRILNPGDTLEFLALASVSDTCDYIVTISGFLLS